MPMPSRSMTKSPLSLARATMQAARKALPAYSHPKSPHKFTQHQLFTCLVLKQFFCTDYRGFVQLLAEWSDLREALALKQLPHYTTLCRAHARLLKKGLSLN